MKHYQPITQHHVLCQSWGGRSTANNLVGLRQNVHQSLHTIFSDDTPIQRLRRLLETDKIALSPATYLAISETLKKFEGLIEVVAYEEDCVDIDRFYKRLNRDV